MGEGGEGDRHARRLTPGTGLEHKLSRLARYDGGRLIYDADSQPGLGI